MSTRIPEHPNPSNRVPVWADNAEGMFYMLWIGLIITVPIIVAVVNLVRGWF